MYGSRRQLLETMPFSCVSSPLSLGMKIFIQPWIKAIIKHRFHPKQVIPPQVSIQPFHYYFFNHIRTFCDDGSRNDEINFEDHELTEQLREIKHVFDLRDPAQLERHKCIRNEYTICDNPQKKGRYLKTLTSKFSFMQARSLKRHVIFHAGPTNSGKTYHAIQQFMKANTGIYCGPLRMLAGEIYRKTNEQKVLCDMLTGEERIWAVNESSPAQHISCTVELCSVNSQYDVAVIDEIQMLRDYDRGWAWSRALLGVPAQEVHICGEEAAIPIVKQLLSKTQDTLEIRKYGRLTPLKIMQKSTDGFERLRRGDCVIAFSQREIFSLRTTIEKISGLKCAVIYGNLPSNVRFDQARQFNDGTCDILVASDAIGMGMNLNIQRIVFSKLSKFDGIQQSSLTPHHTKQIAGRAGRYGSTFETGYVTGLHHHQMKKLYHLMKKQNDNIKKAGILPSFSQFELLSMAMPGKDLLDLTEVFEILMQLDKNYFLCDVERFKMVAREIHSIPLTLSQSYLFSIAPMNILKSSLVCSVMKKFAHHVCEDHAVSRKAVEDYVSWPPTRSPRSLSELQHLEYIHEVLDLYRWLSYRFEDIFCERELVVDLQEELEDIIKRAVNANLKYFKEENKFHAMMRKRKKRRKRKP